jgi:hypothetical protein
LWTWKKAGDELLDGVRRRSAAGGSGGGLAQQSRQPALHQVVEPDQEDRSQLREAADRCRRCGALQSIDHPLLNVSPDQVVEPFLAVEVVVERASGDPSLRGDGSDADRCVAVGAEQLECGGDQTAGGCPWHGYPRTHEANIVEFDIT